MTGIYGFVAEFNPFHNGHKLFIDTIKEKYHPDVLIAVMSGNFVQRGDFAILDKWQRAQIAIENGVDLVIELPFAYAVQPAELFAKGALTLLGKLQVDTLVFGTEETMDFEATAQKILQSENKFAQDYQKSSAMNLTDYYRSIGIEINKFPNQLLGINYAVQILQQKLPLSIKTIERVKSDFSATKIRLNLQDDQDVSDLVPQLTADKLKSQDLNTWENFFPFLKYQIINSSLSELKQIYQMVEGLEYKLKKEVVTSDDFTQFIEQVKSKRYTRARLKRLMMYTLLNAKPHELNKVYDNPYLRVLGFDEVGQKYLNVLKKTDVDLITRVGKKEKDTLALEIRADRIFQLHSKVEQNFGVKPYMKGVH